MALTPIYFTVLMGFLKVAFLSSVGGGGMRFSDSLL